MYKKEYQIINNLYLRVMRVIYFIALFVFGSLYQFYMQINKSEFMLIMKSTELIHRYSFYGKFWLKVAKYLGTPMISGFSANSNFHMNIVQLINPSVTLKNEDQFIEIYVLNGKYLPLFQDNSLNKICCINYERNSYNSFCDSSYFNNPDLFNELLKSKISNKRYTFTNNLTIQEVI